MRRKSDSIVKMNKYIEMKYQIKKKTHTSINLFFSLLLGPTWAFGTLRALWKARQTCKMKPLTLLDSNLNTEMLSPVFALTCSDLFFLLPNHCCFTRAGSTWS